MDIQTADTQRQNACLRFTTLLLGICFLLQRFAVPLGGEGLSVVGPIGLCLAFWGLWTGFLRLDRTRLALFLTVTALAIMGASWHAMIVMPFGQASSTHSLLQFLFLTGFSICTFAVEVDEASFFGRCSNILAVIAAAGILQFAAQFVGIRIFAFGDFLPREMLFETGFNLKIPLGVGEIMKSNGFFLIEPSTFSQFMSVGVIIELLTARSLIRLSLFGLALLLSFSGTGWLVLASFLATAGLGLGRRGVNVALAATLAILAGAFCLVTLAPDIANTFGARMGEISQPGTSGHLRFITPFWVMNDVFSRVPSALFAGIGAGLAERLTLPYLYNVNTPVKIMLEYGLPLLLAYLALFCLARRTKLQGALFVPCMLLFLFAGGYQQFGGVLYPVLLLLVVARLAPSPAAA